MSNSLYQKKASVQFYESRYEQGYMDEWPMVQKERVLEVVRELNLPQKGKALDFGCGNGVFTDIIKRALPHWEVYGSDISQLAVKNAQARFPECHFFVSDLDKNPDLKFDFLFSHHVLEHVFDIKKTIEEINHFLKPVTSMLHVFPCGNKGSLEYGICAMRTDGINDAMENRFFFEDEGHVRRLTSRQTEDLMKVHGFELVDAWYSNQKHGAVKWITQNTLGFCLDLTDPRKAKDATAKGKLRQLRRRFFVLSVLQLPARLHNHLNKDGQNKLTHTFLKVVNYVPNLISMPIFNRVNNSANKEWEQDNKNDGGSEMFLYFRRQVGT